jgi:signal transduction histidine kinase
MGELEIQAAREQEIASQAAYMAKDRFFASMAHELRTPLNAISNYAQLLGEELADTDQMDPATIIKDANRIASAAEYLRSLVDNVLDMSKISTGMLDLYYSPASVLDVVNHVSPIINPLAAKKGISFNVEMPDGNAQVQIDKLRVNQVLINLLSNAIKFTEKGHVTLTIQMAGSEIIFKIQDTGIGMSSSELAMLFQEFKQASAETAAKHGGSGLGLALSQKLATLMGGNITVESTQNLGSTFQFTMPICPPNQRVIE